VEGKWEKGKKIGRGRGVGREREREKEIKV